jgi:UDP-glucuronate decarboxylase
MQKILVTGAAGFIGSSLIDQLLKNPNNYLVGVDNFLTGKEDNLPKPTTNWKFIKADVNNYSDISQVMLNNNFDYVFHYAAVVGVKRTLNYPVSVLNDIDGIKNILNLSKNTGVNRVFFSSSSEVYGEPVVMPQNETTTPLNSRLPYAVVKNIGEAFLKSYFQEFGLHFTIFRFFNTYGPKQNDDFVVSKFINSALKNQDITIYGDGMQTRTFCFIDDNLHATINIFDNNLAVNEIINIGNSQEITVKDLAKIILKITKSKSKIAYLPALPEGDMSRRQPDIAKMQKYLGRKFTSLETGLTNVISWKKAH